MNNGVEMTAQLASTTKEMIWYLLPIGQFAFGVWLALGVLALIILVVALSFRSTL